MASKSKRDAITEYEGMVYGHRVLMRSAEVFLERAVEEPKGSYYQALAAITFAWLAFEAYLNLLVGHIDPKIFEKEQEFFTRKNGFPGVMGKHRWILQRLAASPPRAAERQRRVVLELRRLRDRIVHAKPYRYDGEILHSREEERPAMETAWIDAFVTPARARRYLAAVRGYCEWLNSKIAPPFSDPHLAHSAFDGTPQWQSGRTSLRRTATHTRRKRPEIKLP